MLIASIFSLILCQQVPVSIPVTHELNEQITLHRGEKPAGEESMHPFIVRKIIIEGNKVTRRHIIARELTFKEGDTAAISTLRKSFLASKQNLLNTSLFNFVTFDTLNSGAGHADVRITVEERWYTWPGPIFELADRNFNTWWQTRDLDRINYGFFLYRDNFRGRKERVTFLFKTGYTQQFGISYTIPYLDRRQKMGMGFSISWSRNHEVAYGSMANKQLFYKDEDTYVRKEFSSKLSFSYRPGLYTTFSTEARFYDGKIADTVTSFENIYFAGDLSKMQYFLLNVYVRHDHRDNKSYPLKGYYLDLEAGKNGLGILDGETADQWYAISSARKYTKLSPRWHHGVALKGKLSDGTDVPYFLTRGLGYREYIRGYEYYVMDGQNYLLGKTGFKFCLVKPKIKKIKFLPAKKFNKFHYALYAEAYFDAGYVEDKVSFANNSLNNKWQYGYGAGIHYVTYYDLVLRLEYSRNMLNEDGLFLHFVAPL